MANRIVYSNPLSATDRIEIGDLKRREILIEGSTTYSNYQNVQNGDTWVNQALGVGASVVLDRKIANLGEEHMLGLILDPWSKDAITDPLYLVTSQILSMWN